MQKIYDEEMDDKKFVIKKKKINDGEINNKTIFSLKYLTDKKLLKILILHLFMKYMEIKKIKLKILII